MRFDLCSGSFNELARASSTTVGNHSKPKGAANIKGLIKWHHWAFPRITLAEISVRPRPNGDHLKPHPIGPDSNGSGSPDETTRSRARGSGQRSAGHSNLIAGVAAGPRKLIDMIRPRLLNYGGSLDRQACFLLERGLKTLASHNAQTILNPVVFRGEIASIRSNV